ncbi:hypothetical protein OOK50_03575 [Streptomyces sp. NBC_01789]|nr:hypothetical protein [Streptomyces sp. NBC_01789]
MSTMERRAHATDEPVNVLVSRASRQISEAGPPVPGQTVDSVKADVAEIKEKAHR